MEWYYLQNGGWVGPVSFEVLAPLVFGGTINAATRVRNEALPEWVHAERVPELRALFVAGPPQVHPHAVAPPAYAPQPSHSPPAVTFDPRIGQRSRGST